MPLDLKETKAFTNKAFLKQPRKRGELDKKQSGRGVYPCLWHLPATKRGQGAWKAPGV